MNEKQIKITVFAAGGCGINVLAKYMKDVTPQITKNWSVQPKLVAIDTSRSNISKLAGATPVEPAAVVVGEETDRHDGPVIPADTETLKTNDLGVQTYILGDSGAGKNRGILIKDMQTKLDRCGVMDDIQDINIIIYSMSGGSGSVIGPMIIREATRRKKAVIAIGVVDACSKMDCVNSINTLRTLYHTAETENVYIPTMIYSNIGTGRFIVNNTIALRVRQICDLFLNKTVTELDYTDRLNFLRPDLIKLAGNGVWSFGIVDLKSPEPVKNTKNGEEFISIHPDSIVHSALVINNEGSAPDMFTNVTYLGLSEDLNYLAICGSPISESLIDVLNTKADRFGHTAEAEAVDIATKFAGVKGDIDKSGIIN